MHDNTLEIKQSSLVMKQKAAMLECGQFPSSDLKFEIEISDGRVLIKAIHFCDNRVILTSTFT